MANSMAGNTLDGRNCAAIRAWTAGMRPGLLGK